jgi:adenosylhomocysteine nucleosidase
MSRVAIVAAMEREVRPLVKKWRISETEHDGRRFRVFSKDETVLACGGVGAEAARRAAEAVISLFQPSVVWSAGFAGALDPALRVGDVLQPRRIIDCGDSSSVVFDAGEGVLVSFASIAMPAQKAKLRDSFAAQAVDMEAAAVARAAEARGIAFAAVKAISDESDFAFPEMEQFVDSNGQFSENKFALYAALRPWLWPRVLRLARNSGRAAHALCNRLNLMIANATSQDLPTQGAPTQDAPTEVVERK